MTAPEDKLAPELRSTSRRMSVRHAPVKFATFASSGTSSETALNANMETGMSFAPEDVVTTTKCLMDVLSGVPAPLVASRRVSSSKYASQRSQESICMLKFSCSTIKQSRGGVISQTYYYSPVNI